MALKYSGAIIFNALTVFWVATAEVWCSPPWYIFDGCSFSARWTTVKYAINYQIPILFWWRKKRNKQNINKNLPFGDFSDGFVVLAVEEIGFVLDVEQLALFSPDTHRLRLLNLISVDVCMCVCVWLRGGHVATFSFLAQSVYCNYLDMCAIERLA